ncbi:hypothetical protein [Blastopirellula marina]|uniref:DNA-binding protein n=1 Tax=Blastopirellula marina DSM 3645 TaxID=314230 RepID=A3ZUY9_9BACT|nr:hypothetical protein [Blastopirellula marina]EAQ79725.1 hypothetical protein DSM3645_24490 [Blastopirellula marina DSM 3645]
MRLIRINQLPDVVEAGLMARCYGVRAGDLRDMVNSGQLPGVPMGTKVLVNPQRVDEALLRLTGGEIPTDHIEAIQ